jgi:hypothetical protein
MYTARTAELRINLAVCLRVNVLLDHLDEARAVALHVRS